MAKYQVPTIGGIRKVIKDSGGSGTTIAEVGTNTITLTQLAALIQSILTSGQNTGGGNIGNGDNASIVLGPGLSGGGPVIGNVLINAQTPPWFDVQDGADGEPGPPGRIGVDGKTGGVGPAGPAIYLDANDGADGDPGPPGPAGPTGAQGPQGLPGAGLPGSAGPALFFTAEDGADGADGIPGPVGPHGSAGASGSAGPALFFTAEDGVDGDAGPPGVAGAKGATGNTGAQGPIGPALFFTAEDGTDGDFGPPGPQGIQGIQGVPGAGSPGAAGPALFFTAEDGSDGDIGPPGATGATGATGAQGPAGSSGAGGMWVPEDYTDNDIGLMGYTPSVLGPLIVNGAMTVNAPLGASVGFSVIGSNAGSLDIGFTNNDTGSTSYGRYYLTAGNQQVALFQTTVGYAGSVVTNGPTGNQACLRTLGTSSIVFGTNNTYRGQITSSGYWQIPGSPILATATSVFTGLANFKSADSTLNTTVLALDTSLIVTANETGWYSFKILIPCYEKILGTAGLKIDLLGGDATIAAMPGWWNAIVGPTNSTNGNTITSTTSTATNASLTTSSTIPNVIIYDGTVHITGAGSIGVRTAQNTLNALATESTVVMAGASILLTKIG